MITTALLLATLVSTPSSSSNAVNWDFKNRKACAAKAHELNEDFARLKRELNDDEGEQIFVECVQLPSGLTIEPASPKAYSSKSKD